MDRQLESLKEYGIDKSLYS
nr:hypothetical protein [Paeniclostridium sordellii]